MTIFATLGIYNPPKNLQGMTNNVGLTLVSVILHHGLQLVWSKGIKIGDTNVTFTVGFFNQ